jgi:hypothetical protein
VSAGCKIENQTLIKNGSVSRKVIIYQFNFSKLVSGVIMHYLKQKPSHRKKWGIFFIARDCDNKLQAGYQEIINILIETLKIVNQFFEISGKVLQ